LTFAFAGRSFFVGHERHLVNLKSEQQQVKSSPINLRGVWWTYWISPPSVSADGSRIDFRLLNATGFTECAITREALEIHFWLSPSADASRVLKTFDDGRTGKSKWHGPDSDGGPL
jgi:hypothetical protein